VARDEVNQYLGRKPVSIDLGSLSAGDWLVWDTMELVIAFGIPTGMHLVVDAISISSPAGDAGNGIIFAADNVRSELEDPDDGVGFKTNILTRDTRGIFLHTINAANTGVIMTPMDVYNTMSIQDVAGSTDSSLTFWYHFEEGSMDFSQENEALDIEVRIIEPQQGGPGDQFHQIFDGISDQIFFDGGQV